MSDYKLFIRIPSIKAEIKVVIDILMGFGFSEDNAKIAVQNIKDKKNVDEALDWLHANDISVEESYK
jgi:hypothetical protein